MIHKKFFVDDIAPVSKERLETLINFARQCSKPWLCVDVVNALCELHNIKTLFGDTLPRNFQTMPTRPIKPTQMLDTKATLEESYRHYIAMVDYWIEEGKWQELRANMFADTLKALIKDKTE